LVTASSDTIASEVGKAWGRTTWLIVGWRKVPPGTSGAVSAEGTLAGVTASVLLAGVAASPRRLAVRPLAAGALAAPSAPRGGGHRAAQRVVRRGRTWRVVRGSGYAGHQPLDLRHGRARRGAGSHPGMGAIANVELSALRGVGAAVHADRARTGVGGRRADRH